MATNPVALLNEFCTRNRAKFVDEYEYTGPPNARTFTCTITLQGNASDQRGIGEGKTKKEAKNNAAMDILYKLDSRSEENTSLPLEVTSPGRGVSPAYSNPPTPTSNTKGILQEFCQRNYLSLPVYMLIGKEGPDHQLQFTVRCTVRKTNSQLVGEGIGVASSLKGAEASAATTVHKFLTSENSGLEPIKETETSDGDSIDLGASLSPRSPSTNIKGQLQELCQCNSLLIPMYTVVSKTGPTHSPNFTVKCQVKDLQGEVIEDEYGYGKNVRTAELDAAGKTKIKIQKLIEDMNSAGLGGGASPQFVSKSSRNVPTASGSKGIVDPVEMDELVAQLIAFNCMEPDYLYDTTDPVDAKDSSTVQHLCMAYARVVSGYIARRCRDYDVSVMPVVGQGIGETKEESKKEALLTLICNVRALGIAQ